MTITAIALVLMAGLRPAQDTVRAPVRSVANVDLTRYAGLWHEVARFPNRFQTQCVAETTAEYTLLDNGQVRVINSCTKADGTRTRAEGRARRAKRDGAASQLKVRFAPRILSFLSMVWGDYWILDLTDDYSMALVGDPSRKYLWVLSRTAQPDSVAYERMVATAVAQGFDVSRFVRTR